MNYRITLIESDEGWAVWCDDLPGCCSQGGTRAEAIANIREAITEWLAVRDEDMLRDLEADGARFVRAFITV